MYTAITENDISQWNDETGMLYHFPAKYKLLLTTGTKVIYYKGRIIDKSFANKRLSLDPHYFGIATIGEIRKQENANNYYAQILDFKLFSKAVPFKLNNIPLEHIPDNRKTNYWRDGVRPITKDIYGKIISLTEFVDDAEETKEAQIDLTLTTTFEEGGKKKIYTTIYERNPKLRNEAIKIHGFSCSACDFNFKSVYGVYGEGYIHVHHIKPISSFDEKATINPQTDLVVVCANCHSMIHRRRNRVLDINELRQMIKRSKYT